MKSIIAQPPLNSFRLYGYYIKRISETLSVISLNTQEFFLSEVSELPNEPQQLTWLETVLSELEVLSLQSLIQQKVIIAGHVPPHSKLYRSESLEQFFNIVEQYSSMILGNIYGHVNLDYTRIIYRTPVHLPGQVVFEPLRNDAVGVIFASPGLVPIGKFPPSTDSFYFILANPSFRIFEYNTTHLLDFHMFTAILTNTTVPEFIQTYSFCAAYNIHALDPTSVSTLFPKLQSNQTLWQEYLNRAIVFRKQLMDQPTHRYWNKVLDRICDRDLTCP